MPAHIKASLLGPSLTLPVAGGRLALGTWQGIYLCEHRDHGGARSLLATLRRGGRLARRATPAARFSAKARRALAGVLGGEDRAGDLALALPTPRSSRPVAARSTRIAWWRRARAGRWRRSGAASSRAAATRLARLGEPVDDARARAARSAAIGSPVSASSIASGRGSAGAAAAGAPAAATSPRLTSGMPNFASRAATIRSQASATSKPPATA